MLDTGNATTSELVVSPTKNEEQILQYLQDPTFIILSVCLLLMISIVVVLSVMVFRLRRRPRIKKRIIVNKNITPLTYRPQSTEQCEITIENCCNMNVCETVSLKFVKIYYIFCYVVNKSMSEKLLLNLFNFPVYIFDYLIRHYMSFATFYLRAFSTKFQRLHFLEYGENVHGSVTYAGVCVKKLETAHAFIHQKKRQFD